MSEMHFNIILNGNKMKAMPQKKFEDRVRMHYENGDKVEFKLFDSYPDYVEVQAIVTTKGVA